MRTAVWGRAITRRQAIALGGAVLLLVGAAAGGFREHRLAIVAGNWSRYALEVSGQTRRVLGALVDAETGQRGFLLTGDEAYLQPYVQATRTVSRDIADLRAMTRDNPQQQARIDALAPIVSTKLDELAKTISLRRAQGMAAALDAVRTGAGKSVMDDARLLLAEIDAEERRLLQERLAQRARRSRFAEALMLLAALGGLALGGIALSSIEAQGRERIRAQDRARDSEERLRTTLRSIGDAVIATDTDGTVVFMNGVAEGITGWTDGAARGRPLDEVFRIVNEQTRATIESPVTKVLREGKIVGLANHTVLLARDGREIPIDDSGAPIRDARQEIMGVVLVFRDVSERKRADAERERLVVAEAANAAKDEFLAVLSHELRSPLHAMLGWVTLLKRGAMAPDQLPRAVDTIDRNIRLQADLVDDLLDVSRIVSGKLVLAEAPVALAPIVRASVDSMRPAAHAKGVELSVEMEPAPVVVGDRKRLEQVVTNLLSNAVKFTPRGGRVTVRLDTHEGHARLAVEDTGAGIAPEFLPHVFERFRQGDATITRAHGGLGLGLSIVRHLVERHGGHVTAESSGVDRGSVFRVLLPLRAVEAPPESATEADDTDTLAGISILLVEDDADTREALGLMLDATGARVRTVGSAVEARRVFTDAMPDVIVSDIGMPGENGYELVATLRELADGTPIPAIALTGFAAASDVHAATAAGFDAHMAKPVEPDALVRMIRDVVDRGTAKSSPDV